MICERQANGAVVQYSFTLVILMLNKFFLTCCIAAKNGFGSQLQPPEDQQFTARFAPSIATGEKCRQRLPLRLLCCAATFCTQVGMILFLTAGSSLLD
jgi:hypothetical protein